MVTLAQLTQEAISLQQQPRIDLGEHSVFVTVFMLREQE